MTIMAPTNRLERQFTSSSGPKKIST